jgi:hypothetical protein
MRVRRKRFLTRHDEGVAAPPSRRHVGAVHVGAVSTRVIGRARSRDAPKTYVRGDDDKSAHA